MDSIQMNQYRKNSTSKLEKIELRKNLNQDLQDIQTSKTISDSYRASLYDIKPLRRESVIRL
jgi:hypothetical protein